MTRDTLAAACGRMCWLFLLAGLASPEHVAAQTPAPQDLQVAPHVNAAAIRSALKAAPTDCYTVRVLPGLNHLFQHAKTGAIAEYGRIDETFADDALALIADWIARRVDSGGSPS